jgi:prepilin-type N-terminal cleavage/methylation domain-containing protein
MRRFARTERPSERDDGFTLIELLVVIVIIGILAGIAIGVFLNQRQKSYDSAAKSDLRNFAAFEEVYLGDFDTYGTLAQVEASEPEVKNTRHVTVTLVAYDSSNGYCLSAKHSGSTRTWYYDSRAGGLQPTGSTGCPVSTTGLPGGSVP